MGKLLKKPKFLIFLLTTVILLTVVFCYLENQKPIEIVQAQSNIEFYGDFESGFIDMSKWSYAHGNQGAPYVTVVDFPVRSGNKAAKFYIGYDEPGLNWKSMIGPSNLETGYLYRFAFNKDHWVGYSMFIPVEWVADTAGDLTFQFHAEPDNLNVCDIYRSPTLALYTNNDGAYKQIWHTRWDSDQCTLSNYDVDGVETVWTGVLPKGQWIDFVVNYRPSWGSDGLIKVWQDGELIVNRSGPNAYNDRTAPFLRIGAYKWHWRESGPTSVDQRIVYFDELRIGNENSSYEEVSPGGSQSNYLAPDLDHDYDIDFDDLTTFKNLWGVHDLNMDFNQNSFVGAKDFGIMMSLWGNY